MKNLLMLVFGLICVTVIFAWCADSVKDTYDYYGGNYENCLDNFKPSECKRVFLD